MCVIFRRFRLADPARSGQLGTTTGACRPEDLNVGELPVTKAAEVLSAAHEALDSSWTEHDDTVARFDAFRFLDDEANGAWIAYAVAISLQAKPTYDQRRNPLQNWLAQLLDIDVAAWWRPTPGNFFDGIRKGGLLQLLHDLGGLTLSSHYAASKKPEISSNCEKLCADQAIVEEDVRTRALTWVPDAMRFLEPDTAVSDALGCECDESGKDDTDELGAFDGGRGEEADLDDGLESEFVDDDGQDAGDIAGLDQEHSVAA